jgi:hypothetical protein
MRLAPWGRFKPESFAKRQNQDTITLPWAAGISCNTLSARSYSIKASVTRDMKKNGERV